MLGQIVQFGKRRAAQHQEYLEAVFRAHFDPFFGNPFPFVDSQRHALAGPAIDHNTFDAAVFQVVAIFVDDIVVDGAESINEDRKKVCVNFRSLKVSTVERICRSRRCELIAQCSDSAIFIFIYFTVLSHCILKYIQSC